MTCTCDEWLNNIGIVNYNGATIRYCPWCSRKLGSISDIMLHEVDRLLMWLEYGRQSGYIAARCDKAQEERWADHLRDLIAERNQLWDDLRHPQTYASRIMRELDAYRSEYMARNARLAGSHDGQA